MRNACVFAELRPAPSQKRLRVCPKLCILRAATSKASGSFHMTHCLDICGTAQLGLKSGTIYYGGSCTDVAVIAVASSAYTGLAVRETLL